MIFFSESHLALYSRFNNLVKISKNSSLRLLKFVKEKYSIKKVAKTIPCENISEKYDFSQKCMVPKLPKEITHSKVEDIQNSLNSITKALNEKNRLVDNNNSNKIDVYSKSEDSKNNVDFPKLIKFEEKSIANLEPGSLADTNILMHFEDYPEFLCKGKKFGEKLGSAPLYIISKSKDEYIGKRQPKNRRELVRDKGYSGNKRNFDRLIEKLPNALNRNVYYVDITKCTSLTDNARKLMSDLKNLGLHVADSYFLAFAKMTDSQIITCDKVLIRSCNLSQCRNIEFNQFAEKIMQPSPITVVTRERRILRRKNSSKKKNCYPKKSEKKFHYTYNYVGSIP